MEISDWEAVFSREVEGFNKAAPDPSSAHQLDHCVRVWQRCQVLGEKLGADLEVLVAAAFLHDLGRQLGLELHGEKSAELAEPILRKHSFPEEKVPEVLQAIAKHDYQTSPEERKTLESKILYDSDKMDAFGAMGIIRHIQFYYLKGKTANEILEMLPKRWEGIMLDESRELAKKDYEYIIVFFQKLNREVRG
ncbi:HD domain-containing protein [Candidatus Altiarchaeota archaeon]